jgi:5,10-methylenetetrahydromethanopterin reductase
VSADQLALGLQIVPTMGSAELIDTIVVAEELGYSYCMVADEGLMLDVYAVLGAAARATSTIRLGAVTNPYTRHPAATAAAVATVDEMSGGRAFVTLVAGGTMVLHPMGLQRSAPLALVADTIEALQLLWRGEPVTWQGRRLSLEGAQLTTGTHSIPVWVAARGERMLRLAGAQADGLVLMVKSDLGDAFGIADQARQATRTDPGAGSDRSALTRVYLDRLAYRPEMIEEAKHLYGYAIMDSPPRILKNLGLDDEEIAGLRHAFEQGGPEAVGRLVTDELVASYQIAGTPAGCRDQLEHLIGAHRLDAFFVNVISPGPTANRELLTEVVAIAAGR